MGFKVGDNVIITPPDNSVFYKKFCGIVGTVTTVYKSGKGLIVDTDGNGGGGYWPLCYISPIEDDEDIELLNVLDMM